MNKSNIFVTYAALSNKLFYPIFRQQLLCAKEQKLIAFNKGIFGVYGVGILGVSREIYFELLLIRYWVSGEICI